MTQRQHRDTLREDASLELAGWGFRQLNAVYALPSNYQGFYNAKEGPCDSFRFQKLCQSFKLVYFLGLVCFICFLRLMSFSPLLKGNIPRDKIAAHR